jgi:hypothetical protein
MGSELLNEQATKITNYSVPKKNLIIDCMCRCTVLLAELVLILHHT